MEYTVNLGKESLRKIADAISGGVVVEPLEVTENGEYTAPDGKAYSPVSVNVAGGGGSSDFSTAKVTIDTLNVYKFSIPVPGIFSSGDISAIVAENVPGTSAAVTYTVPLYKGMCIIAFKTSGDVDVSGDCKYENGQFIITGDCSITVHYQKESAA